MKSTFARLPLILLSAFSMTQTARAWDYEGHRAVNLLAITSLPTNFPGFVREPAARERIAFLGGEADRWRNVPGEITFSHCTETDHYIDLEELKDYGLTPQTLPIFRYDFTDLVARVRAANPTNFAVIDPARNRNHTRHLPGLLPWAIVEQSGRLKSGFSYLKAYEQYGGTPEEIANAKANILYVMGVMGHFVGDASQPLHTTIHHHGWVGPNPRGYTTRSSIHQWIDGGFWEKTGGIRVELLADRIRPAESVAATPEQLFKQVMVYIEESFRELEPLYQLEKDGKLTGEGATGLEGRPFMEARIVNAGQMLGNIWYSAWLHAPEDGYLRDKLQKRQRDGTPATR